MCSILFWQPLLLPIVSPMSPVNCKIQKVMFFFQRHKKDLPRLTYLSLFEAGVQKMRLVGRGCFVDAIDFRRMKTSGRANRYGLVSLTNRIWLETWQNLLHVGMIRYYLQWRHSTCYCGHFLSSWRHFPPNIWAFSQDGCCSTFPMRQSIAHHSSNLEKIFCVFFWSIHLAALLGRGRAARICWRSFSHLGT